MADVTHNTHNGGLQGLEERLRAARNRSVYVGIPMQKSSRPKEEINNAELLYIHTHGIRRRAMINEMDQSMAQGNNYSAAFELYLIAHGSPLWHSPPRPVLEPAIEYYHKEIADQFSRVIAANMENNQQAATRELIRTGLLAQNYCRGWFVNPANHWPPNSPKTIELKGSSKPLIDTGTLRKSIVYVIDDHERGIT